jgi:dihydropteroate synthase
LPAGSRTGADDLRQSTRRDSFLRLLGTRPAVMGILNLTPDSFSDRGRHASVEAAVRHATALAEAGCDIIDIGGESVRPGATPVSVEEELARIEPVMAALAKTLDVPLSIDTSKARVAGRALEHGAVMVNDVWGLQKDPAMAGTVAGAEAAVVIMHNRIEKDEAIDIIADIRRFFDCSLDIAARAGIARKHIILDPGIAFAKTSRQNRDIILRLPELADYRLPIMVGVSRKAFLGSLSPGSPEATLAGTVSASLSAAAAGATLFRVHDVAEHVAALRVFATIRGS